MFELPAVPLLIIDITSSFTSNPLITEWGKYFSKTIIFWPNPQPKSRNELPFW